MGLRQVLMALGKEWSAQEEKLKERLALENVRCVGFGDGQNCREQLRSQALSLSEECAETVRTDGLSAADTVVITDDRELAAEMAGRGFVCIGCEAGEESFFEGAALVTDVPETLDVRSLEECLLRATGRPVTIAVTDRLVLREITEQDIPGLYRISMQEGMREAVEGVGENCFEPDRMKAYIHHMYRLCGYGLWSVLLRDGTLAGCCGFADYTERHAVREEPKKVEKNGRKGTEEQKRACLELQYVIAEEYRRQGYGEEMCRAAIEYAYDRLCADELWVRVKTKNRASLALAGKLGFAQVCTDSAGIAYFRKLREAL